MQPSEASLLYRQKQFQEYRYYYKNYDEKQRYVPRNLTRPLFLRDKKQLHFT